MATQILSLGVLGDGALTFDGSDAILLDSALVAGNAIAYFRYLRISGNDIRVRLAVTTTGNASVAGPEFTDAVENYVGALTFSRVDGSNSITLPGPGHSSNSVPDSSDPYFWGPPSSPSILQWRADNLGEEIQLTIFDGVVAPPFIMEGEFSVSVTLDGAISIQNFYQLIGDFNVSVSSTGSLQTVQPKNYEGSFDIAISIPSANLVDARPGNYLGELSVEFQFTGNISIANPVKVDPIYLLPEFPLNNVATMPLLHIDDATGSRQRGDFSSSVDFTAIRTVNNYQLFVYLSAIPSIIGSTMFTIGSGADAITVRSIGTGVQVVGQSEQWSVSEDEGPFIFIVENVNEGGAFINRVSLVSARNGKTLHVVRGLEFPAAMTFIPGSSSWGDVGVTHIYFNSGSGSTRKFSAVYGSATKFRFNSLYFIPITAKVIRGRDSQRQLTPPRVPSLDCSIWDFDGSIYLDRPYSSGVGVSLFAMLPSGEQRLMFTGVIDTVGYKYANSVFTFTINALGMTSKLIRDKLYGEIFPDVTLAQCIRTTLTESSWPDDAIQLNDLEFGTILSYWWLEGDSGWDSIQRLVNTEGPPSVFYEDNFGELVFLGTGRTVATITDSQTVGIAIEGDERVPIPVIGNVKEKSETKYVINHADMDVIEYTTPDEDEDVWLRKAEFRILPMSSYDIRASFGGPLLNYANAEKPDFEATTEDLVVSYTDKAATRAIVHFENNTNRIIRVRNVRIQGRVLKIGSRVQVSSDSMDDLAITKSQDDHGLREWPGRVYNTITEFAGEQLVNNIVGSYHLGVETFFLSLYGNMPNALSTMLRFEETFSIRTPSLEGAQISDVQQPVDLSKINNAAYVRKLIHEWKGGFYTLGVETESRSMAFYGVPSYIIGVSLLGGIRGFSA